MIQLTIILVVLTVTATLELVERYQQRELTEATLIAAEESN